MRTDKRSFNELREVKITRDYLLHPSGSVLIEMGNTRVLCTAMIEEQVPRFLKGKNTGWITSEYSMLPASTGRRKVRDSTRGRIDGRTQEIQRLIGRTLRTVVDLSRVGERTIWIDCDVIQADGGTRTAAITGSFVALVDALAGLYKDGRIKEFPISNYLAAVSVGLGPEGPLLDISYEEDSGALVDMNIVMNDRNEFIEIQGTGEESAFTRSQLNQILDLAEIGIEGLIKIQKESLGDLNLLIEDKGV